MNELDAAEAAFHDGGVVLYPTTTLWGLGGDASSPHVIDKIADIKGRSSTVPFLVLVADADAIEGLACRSDLAQQLIDRFWPGPLTLLLPAGPNAPTSLVGPEGLVGIRQAQHLAPRGLLERTGGWLISTSANRHGEPAPSTLDSVGPRVREQVDAILSTGPPPGGLPSTIVAVEESVRLVRQGAIPWSQITR
ncbi:MAG: L-threonylcarbamoyladenylate synthase [Myxococcota bacterium]|jgi:L-threonylcarbamoyladenylate synthase